MKINKQKL